jgi:hypothetical protein
MTDTQKLLHTIDNQITALYKAYQDNKITLDELMNELSIIERISLTIQKIEKDITKSIKDGLELTDEFQVGQRKYYYKDTTASVFDTKKAKSTLESLDYNLEDFTTLQFRKKLTYEL